jgi:hypothetical protein
MYNDYNLSYIFGFFFYTRIMVISVTFNNISVISWWTVLLVNETAGADPGGGAHPGPPPPLIFKKNMIFWRKIVIFHTKYPKIVHASLRSAQFF